MARFVLDDVGGRAPGGRTSVAARDATARLQVLVPPNRALQRLAARATVPVEAVVQPGAAELGVRRLTTLLPRHPVKSVFNPEDTRDLLRRLERLTPTSERRWGRMSPSQAVGHLADFFRAALRERPLARRPWSLRRLLVRFVGFTLPLPWPCGLATSAELDTEKQGTPPGAFAQDVAELKRLLVRFAATRARGLNPHYAWGHLTRGEWGRYAYRHVDHHLRQFGV